MTRNDLGGWLRKAAARLSSESEHPLLEAQVLAAELLKRDRTWICAHPESLLTDEEISGLDASLKRRENGEPLPYILGHWEFFGRDFRVTPDVLIPRPETELLVETALEWLKTHPDRRRAVDVGTGSGCIAITLALEIQDLRITAVDISASALAVAAENIHQFAGSMETGEASIAQRVSLAQSDLLTNVPGTVDLLCANLPYIPSPKLAVLRVAQHEPRLALDGGPDGLRLVERLLVSLNEHLETGGLALFEIEADQGMIAAHLARSLVKNAQVEVLKDLAGLDRVLKVVKCG